MENQAIKDLEIYGKISKEDQDNFLRYMKLLIRMDKAPSEEAEKLNNEMIGRMNSRSIKLWEIEDYLDQIEAALDVAEGRLANVTE